MITRLMKAYLRGMEIVAMLILYTSFLVYCTLFDWSTFRELTDKKNFKEDLKKNFTFNKQDLLESYLWVRIIHAVLYSMLVLLPFALAVLYFYDKVLMLI